MPQLVDNTRTTSQKWHMKFTEITHQFNKCTIPKWKSHNHLTNLIISQSGNLQRGSALACWAQPGGPGLRALSRGNCCPQTSGQSLNGSEPCQAEGWVAGHCEAHPAGCGLKGTRRVQRRGLGRVRATVPAAGVSSLRGCC